MSFIREYILVTGDDYIMANYISTNFLMSSSEKHTCWTQISCQGMNVEVARTNVFSCDYKDSHLC